MEPSSADTGFMLSMQPLENPYLSDPAYQRILEWYLPQETLSTIQPRLTKFGDEAVSEQVHEWIGNAERDEPYVKTRNVWGQKYPYDRLVTSNGWKQLGRWGSKNGNFIYSASSAAYSCPVSMTSGAARLVGKHLPGLPSAHPFHEFYRRLTSRENNWISSQWMTERPGGSDVRNSETVAVYSPLKQKTGQFGTIEEGDYLVSGFKFFASATDCNMCLMLAKTESGELSLFVAPVRIGDRTNGIRFLRLKNKYGTKELPTAELELKDVRAWRIGPIDRGIATIALLLNVTRTHNFITALSCWRRGIAIAKSFAKARTTMNQPLWAIPMHLRFFANMEVKFRGLLQLAFFTTALLSFVDNGFPTEGRGTYAPLPDQGEQAQVVLRLLTAMSKAVICKTSTVALQDCQEALGGVGYLDEPDEPEYNICRLMRDTAANVTWEGTVNVLASEVVRHLLRGGAKNLRIVDTWLQRSIASVSDNQLRTCLSDAWSNLRQRLDKGENDLSTVLADSRQLMYTLAWIISGILLAIDAGRDSDATAEEVARRWIMDDEVGLGEFVITSIAYSSRSVNASKQTNRTDWDCRIVWNCDLPAGAATGYRTEDVRAKI
ncbi:hypothetical protein NA57DRAFT_63732 [Rhizodiscina lignyota]|uniref:Acyl-CoA dehydrogenase n=1 Tax=Rhizodiscina lignyota TaxID=1504668 RepID=A0A9P4MD24_9PEZI|nr:hypothetical protein NA57DRAFT_63732 [Rhizodiscina lignyota]